MIIPGGVTSIGGSAFTGTSITSLTLPIGIITIGEYAFSRCKSLTKINIPDGITDIGEWTFYHCENLSYIEIPASVENIGSKAFYGCTKLKDICCYRITPPTLGSEAFDNNASDRKICVPVSAIETYKNDPNWSYYKDVIVGNEYKLADGVPTEYYLTFESSKITIPIPTNLAPEVSISYSGSETDWITYNGFSSEPSLENELTFTIASNKGAYNRHALIKLYNNKLNQYINLSVSQAPFSGIDDSYLDKNKYITYVADEDYSGNGNAFDYNMYYYGTKIYSDALARSSKIEYKFSLKELPTNNNVYITARESDDSVKAIYLNGDGLCIGHKTYTWTDMGVNATDIITLSIDGSTMIVNEKTITGIPTGYLSGYIWSGYYYDSDDGVYSKDYTFQDGAKIYYAKGWDSAGELIYIGGASLSSDERACWKSVYYDNVSGNLQTNENFPRVTSSFGKGNL